MRQKKKKSTIFRKILDKKNGVKGDKLNTIEHAMRRVKSHHPATILKKNKN